jgi:endothelin-converting enzyme/putative endopeptidase
VGRNKQGIIPLLPYLAKIDQARNVQDLQKITNRNGNPIGGITLMLA